MPLPFIKFYPGDWEKDSQLMGCSLAARGLWVHMMRVMHEADPYGFFIGRNGEPVVLNSFALRIGALPKDVKKAFEELDHEGVFSRDSHGRIYSRRMVRDEAKRQQLHENGAQSGGANASDLVGQIAPAKGGASGGQFAPGSVHAIAPNSETQKLRGLDTDSLRSSAVAFGSWPSDVQGLQSLAMVFIAAFANCRDEQKTAKHMPPYTQVLATMRSRGVTLAQAWQACEDALTANNNKPLFAATIKTAVSFLPARTNSSQAPASKPKLRVITAADIEAMG